MLPVDALKIIKTPVRGMMPGEIGTATYDLADADGNAITENSGLSSDEAEALAFFVNFAAAIWRAHFIAEAE